MNLAHAAKISLPTDLPKTGPEPVKTAYRLRFTSRFASSAAPEILSPAFSAPRWASLAAPDRLSPALSAVRSASLPLLKATTVNKYVRLVARLRFPNKWEYHKNRYILQAIQPKSPPDHTTYAQWPYLEPRASCKHGHIHSQQNTPKQAQ